MKSPESRVKRHRNGKIGEDIEDEKIKVTA